MNISLEFRKSITLIVILAALIRGVIFFGYLSHNERYFQVDSSTYHRVATSLAEGKGLMNTDGSPHFYRVPGYASFIAMGYRCGLTKQGVMVVQLILSLLIPVLMMYLTALFFPKSLHVCLGMGFLGALHLGFSLYASFFMTETLFVIMLLLFYRSFFMALDESHRYTLLIFAGFLLGIASLIRPVGHYMMIIPLGMLWFFSSSYAMKIKRIVIFFGAWLSVVFWWLLRNYMLTGALFFHTLPGGHFLYLSAARVAMDAHNISYPQARKLLEIKVKKRIACEELALKRPLSEIEICVIHEKEATYYFTHWPRYALKYWLTDMFRTCFSLYASELYALELKPHHNDYFAQGRGLIAMIKKYIAPQGCNWQLICMIYTELFFLLFMWAGALGFMWQAWWQKSYRSILIKTMPFVLFFIVIALSGGYARMRLPAEPLLLMMAWAWWCDLYTNHSSSYL